VTGGSWSGVGNWNLAPLFISDEWLDFSTLDLSAANTSNLDGSRTIGGLRFGDVPTATHDWTLAPGSGGNLTLSTTTGLPPEIEVINRSATITAALAGNQGFTKSGAGVLVLNHPGNTLTGPLNVTGGTLQIRDGSTNAPAIFDSITDRPITLQSGAILDLPRLHSFTLQTVNWQLPGITMNDGATLQFRAQVGSNAHQLPAPIDVSGTVTMNNHGGAFAQDVSLTGPLSGSGMIQYLATSGSSSSTTTRTLTVSNPENTYSGDWFVDYTGSTSDDFVALRPTASGALGTGSVTLDDRARLLGGTASSLNSLSGIIVAKPTATLDFQGQPWTQPAAVLDVRDGTVESGGASISIGSLLQSGGSIRLVAGAAAPLVLGGDAVFTGGNILLTVTGNPAGQSFEILRYSGNLTGTPQITIVGADRLTPSIDFGDGTDDVITVTFPAGADLVWRGNQVSNPGVWDIDQTDNWVRGSTPDRFLQADHVRFDDSALSSNINLTGSALPSSVIFDHSVLDLTLAGPGALSGPVGIVKSGSARLTIASAQGHSGGMLVTLGEVTAGHPGAFGSGTVTLRHAAASSIPTRVNLSSATMANDFVLDTNAVTGDSGAIHAAPGNTLSELSGTLTVQSTVGDGGHLSSAAGGILRLSGTLNSSGPVPVLHSGIFEMATSGGNLAELTLSKGTIRLAQADGIQPTLRLNLASAGPATLDLHGFSQTLAELRQSSTHSAQVTNSAGSAATLVIDGTVDHSFGGSIADGSGAIGLVKRGTSRLTLAGTCDHSGGTFIEAGTLSLSTATLADVSTVAISTGAVLDLPHGQEDTVAGLVIDDVAQPPGKYDASRSSFITGSGSLIVTSGPITDPFEIWAAAAGLDGSPGKAAGFDEDPDGDGFANGLEWILGGDPLDGRSGGLVTPAEDGGLVLSFTRNPQALGEVSLTVEYGGSLLDPWNSVVIGPASSGPDASGVTVEIDSSATPHEITVSIPASHSTNGRLFARLKAVRP
jgi:autotransporter-associated beta strand protein